MCSQHERDGAAELVVEERGRRGGACARIAVQHVERGPRRLAPARCGRGARRDERSEGEGALGVERRVPRTVLEAALVLVPAETERERFAVGRAVPEIGDGLAGPVLLAELIAAPEEAPALPREVRERA